MADEVIIKMEWPITENWNIEEMTGYKPITTFWQDFTIADHFGIDAVKDTYNRAFNEWKENTEYLTELVLALNWKIWQHWKDDKPQDSPENKLASTYNDLWLTADNYARENLTGDDLIYYYNTTD